MEKFAVNNILKVSQIESEFELEQATFVYNKLRLLVKEDASLKPIRTHLAILIEQYEAANWSDSETIDDAKIAQSDSAMQLSMALNAFVEKRKAKIKTALKKYELLQNDLAEILGHKKSYMSELINGIRPLSQNDILIIHRLLNISFEDLIPPFIKEKDVKRIRTSIEKLNKPDLKLRGKDIDEKYALGA